MTIRKNFLFDDEVAGHLEEIAKVEGKTQTQIAQEAIEARYNQMQKAKRLEAFGRIAGSLGGKVGDIDPKNVRKAVTAGKYAD